MPDEGHAARIAERCQLHPGRRAIATCDRCDRPLCLQCATPVRGRVIGPECLQQMVGGQLIEPEPESASSAYRSLPGWGLAIAAAASALPWTRFGTGSGFLGAWSTDLRWSFFAAACSLAALVIWLIARGSWPRGARVVAIFGGGCAIVGGLLAFWNPPPFTRPFLGPLVAILGGLIAVGASVAQGLSAARRAEARVA